MRALENNATNATAFIADYHKRVREVYPRTTFYDVNDRDVEDVQKLFNTLSEYTLLTVDMLKEFAKYFVDALMQSNQPGTRLDRNLVTIKTVSAVADEFIKVHGWTKKETAQTVQSSELSQEDKAWIADSSSSRVEEGLANIENELSHPHDRAWRILNAFGVQVLASHQSANGVSHEGIERLIRDCINREIERIVSFGQPGRWDSDPVFWMKHLMPTIYQSTFFYYNDNAIFADWQDRFKDLWILASLTDWRPHSEREARSVAMAEAYWLRHNKTYAVVNGRA